jgi:hypothetical protein
VAGVSCGTRPQPATLRQKHPARLHDLRTMVALRTRPSTTFVRHKLMPLGPNVAMCFVRARVPVGLAGLLQRADGAVSGAACEDHGVAGGHGATAAGAEDPPHECADTHHLQCAPRCGAHMRQQLCRPGPVMPMMWPAHWHPAPQYNHRFVVLRRPVPFPSLELVAVNSVAHMA